MLSWVDAEEYATQRSADLAASKSDVEIEQIEFDAENAAARPSFVRRVAAMFAGGTVTIETLEADKTAAADALHDSQMAAYLG